MNLDRRSLIRLLVLSGLSAACARAVRRPSGPDFNPGDRRRFDFIRVRGSYREIGRRLGAAFKDRIRESLRRRAAWMDSLRATAQSARGGAYSDELRRLTRLHFPFVLDEIEGMAEGAGMDFGLLWLLAVQCEMESMRENPDACSTLFFRNTSAAWLFHNEDGNGAYGDLMAVAHVVPPTGVEFISMLYPGVPAGVGPSLNGRGIIQTTNYLGSTHPVAGVPRYALSRAALEAKTLKEALQIAAFTPRAYPCHHNLASAGEGRYVSIEATPEGHALAEPTSLYVHTNHILLGAAGTYPYEEQVYRAKSSVSRYEVIMAALKTLDLKNARAEDFLKILSSHKRAPYSPCRHPRGDVAGLTLGTASYDIRRGAFRLYKGNPCHSVPQGAFTDYAF